MREFVCVICGKPKAMSWAEAQDGTIAYFHRACYDKLCKQRRASMLRNIKLKCKVDKEGQHGG